MFEVSNKLYDLIPAEHTDKIKSHNIYGLDIPFSPSWKNIGINLSGGADSACLAMLLATIITENNYDCKIHVITFVRCWQTRPWQEPIGHDVYNKLKTMFPNTFAGRYENYIPPELEYGVSGPIINGRSGDQIEGSSFNQYISYKHKFDATFNATSKNPKAEGFENRMEQRDKDPENGELTDVIYYSKGAYFCHPFRFVQKDWIIAQYYLHNAVDLYNTTRSCEGDINDGNAIHLVVPTLESYNPSIEVPTCGKCFWCLERNWAEAQLEKTIDQLNNE